MDTNTKNELLNKIKAIDIKEMYASEDEQKRKWFRFGAYDALRMVSELIIAYPEGNKDEVKPKN